MGGSLEAWMELSRHEWQHERGVYSYTMSRVVRSERGLLGLLIAYTAGRHAQIDWSFGCSAPYLPADLVRRNREAHRLVTFLFPAIPADAYYIQNIALDPSAQGMGLGRRLMEEAFAQARAAGCGECHLDVNSAQPAVQFYQHLGMEVLVKTEVPRIPGIACHYRMVKSA
jgi:ribosomal protein S18 acetylase RimI-like enzyme